MLVGVGLIFGHLLGKAISEGRSDVALHCFELLFKSFGVGRRVLFLGLLEFEQAVPVGRNRDRGVLGTSILVDAGFDGCEESQWVIPNSRLIVWEGNQAGLQPVCAVVVHNISEGLG